MQDQTINSFLIRTRHPPPKFEAPLWLFQVQNILNSHRKFGVTLKVQTTLWDPGRMSMLCDVARSPLKTFGLKLTLLCQDLMLDRDKQEFAEKILRQSLLINGYGHGKDELGSTPMDKDLVNATTHRIAARVKDEAIN